MSPKAETLFVAVKLFDLFGYETFTQISAGNKGIHITERDIKHIKLFNCLSDAHAGGTHSYFFTKDPKQIKF